MSLQVDDAFRALGGGASQSLAGHDFGSWALGS